MKTAFSTSNQLGVDGLSPVQLLRNCYPREYNQVSLSCPTQKPRAPKREEKSRTIR